MRVLVWLIEDTWEATIAAAAAILPGDAEVTLLHVAAVDAETVARAAGAGLLGRGGRQRPESAMSLSAISEQAADQLLDDAETRIGRLCSRRALRGRVEREVIAAAADVDVLVMARDGDRKRLGPHSLGPQARFVLDHVPCQVLLIWPDEPPSLTTIPPPLRGKPPPPPPR